MKRSEIQAYIAQAKALLEKNNFKLPEFGYWTLDEWKAREDELETIIKTMRGWDVTDFGSGDFEKVGAVLFTIRNGVLGTDIGCPYAEKLIIMRDSQVLPLHYHFSKTEDIINRGGGVLSITVYNSLADESVDYEGDVTLYTDGFKRTVPAGTTAVLVLEQADLYQVTSNDKLLSETAGVIRAWQSDDDVMIELGSGKYRFDWRVQAK